VRVQSSRTEPTL